MSYKYSRTIQNGAEALIDGIENIEMFLGDEDNWRFHDSDIKSFHWDRDTRTFTVTVLPMAYSTVIDGFDDEDTILLDFHFEDWIEIHIPEFTSCDYWEINELEIIKVNDHLECWFHGHAIRIKSYRLRVDKPRLAKED